MSASESPITSLANLGQRARRDSLSSLSGAVPIDREQLAQALDKIHNSACHSDTLTTFNEFASPPPPSNTESKGLAGDIMQNGFSGLYNRFRGAVGGSKEKSSPTLAKTDQDSVESLSLKSQTLATPGSKGSIAPSREDSSITYSPVQLSTSSSRLQSPTASSFAGHTSESTSQANRSSKASYISTAATTPGTSNPISTRPSVTPMTKAISSSVVVPTLDPVNVNAFKDGQRGRVGADRKAGNRTSSIVSESHESRNSQTLTNANLDYDTLDDDQASGTVLGLHTSHAREFGVDGIVDVRTNAGSNSASSVLSSLHKRPSAIDRITQSHLPGYQASRASSTDRSTADISPINTSAHNSVRHGSFSAQDTFHPGPLGRLRIPGTTINEGAPEAVSARLEQMRKQVLSKEFWMADEICKECFHCGDTFSAFRRKHHCRTCGCIFDNKCTSTISGQRFGVQGSLRVCKTCLDIINRRHDSSGSEDSADEATLPSFFQTQQAKYESANRADHGDTAGQSQEEGLVPDDVNRPLATPMMAIPTRRIGDSSNRRSAVLEIDAPQLSRPSSSRSLKALSAAGRPPSSGHKRHLSKHNIFGRFKPAATDRAPFHRGMTEDMSKGSRLPAFHDDNIIDPDLAPYMSDEESSGDEQLSIFATMNSGGNISHSFENDRSGFGSLLNSNKKYRTRADKSVSGISFASRGAEEPISATTSLGGFVRSNRRRNLSAASTSMHHARTSPRQITPGFGNLDEEISQMDNASMISTRPPSRMIRSASMRDARAPVVELNSASLHHVRRLLRQLLQDANIPNVSSWEKALMPILLQCTDDVNPNVRLGDDIDIRHYVKLKKIPGGKPGDTSYVSGVVFTKNVALKSMPRSISNPRIVIVSFPIEYQRHQQNFMSLEPVIAQEKEFLKNMVNRIASLRPQVLLVQKNISGLALQYLSEAGIAVVYNVKQSVIEAVSRCAQTEIISSIDMVALKPVHVGKSLGFDVKTYVHNDMPGKKKTYIYLSGCAKELGCTIALRGADMQTLTKMKRITEFMVYVVYNLKLETCLMRDEFVLVPSVEENSGTLSLGRQQTSELASSSDNEPKSPQDRSNDAPDTTQAASELGKQLGYEAPDANGNTFSTEKTDQPSISHDGSEMTVEPPKVVSAHESHSHGSHDDQVPEDIPMPTFYSDMVSKHQTKILSASPFVKFSQPYLLMRAREQERRLVYLKRLRDQDTYEEQTDTERTRPQRFQLIKPEMVHETLSKAPRPIMEVLHAVHDAEYDKALHNYQTQKRQWENYIQGNINLFDPYAHQNITVLYTVVCTATSIPCAGPELLALVFYNEHSDYDGDCTLGQYVEDLCMSATTICALNGCERKMSEHHRTYVHGEARVTVFVEKSLCKIKGLQDSILMWSYCKICQKETQVMPMSESTWKYSLGKYLELSFWSSDLRLRAGFCPHNLHRDHLRYFGFRNMAVRIHYDPIDLLEIVVPRTRITWKVDNDLHLKNEIFTKFEDRWNRYMTSVHSRIKGINIDSVAPEKTEACKGEVERLKKRAQDEHAALIKKLQQKYMESKYYEIIPLNRALRAMQEKVAEWDDAFADFDANYFPSEKDIRRLAALQLRKMFMDRDESTSSLVSTETHETISDVDEKSPGGSFELTRKASTMTTDDVREALASVVEEISPPNLPAEQKSLETRASEFAASIPIAQDLDHERVDHLDLALPTSLEPDELSPTPTQAISDPFSDNVNPDSREALQPADSSLEATLSEKVEKLRKANRKSGDHPVTSETSNIPRPTERGAGRRSGTASSPPLNRTQSQPAGTLRRAQNVGKLNFKQGDSRPALESPTLPMEGLKSVTTDPIKPADKKLSERLGLGTLKSRKPGQSLIPRSVQGKRKESKVSTLAKHFEQLSREFEKERLKDRRQRAAKVTQSRAFPKASSKPIVEVYKDVNEAVEERSSTDEALRAVESAEKFMAPTSTISGLADLNTERTPVQPGPSSPAETTATAEETATEADTDDNHNNVSQTGSDDEGVASDTEHALLEDILPGVADFAESFEKPDAEASLELPRHEKTSLMKMLTNFWAERSASGWTPLDYPLSVGDHIFADEDVIIREDEPSSLIAFALNSQHYKSTLEDIRSQGKVNNQAQDTPTAEHPEFQNMGESEGVGQAEVETSLLRATGTHLAYSFVNGNAKMQCKIFFAEQFDAVRRKCGVSDRIVESLSRCLKWDSKGGKTKSVFLKTLDDRLILKQLSPIETAAFLKFAPAYFNIMAEALFHDLPSVIAKMLGFYQIIIKNPTTGIEIKWDVLVMENLFYDRSPTRLFDLKGSMRNRKIQSTGEQNEVLLDENMVEFIYASPLFAREHSKKLLRAAIFNDTLFLQRNDVMDYSLMVGVDEARKELVVGIIDVVRTYTWDKKLESWIKDRGFAGGGRNRPTVTSPKEYKSRFREAMNRYILQAPNSWHQWQGNMDPRTRDGKGGNVSFAEKE